uniref:Uncharacterized protein n=1 Tax=Arundo donax TaxID=35708 RepID=A0A0A9BTY1_ARUDO
MCNYTYLQCLMCNYTT